MAYTIKGRKSGTVRFTPSDNGTVETESLSLSSKVTSNPVESGADINDHVINDMARFNVSGTIIGGDKAVAALKNMRDKRDILTYTGRSRAKNLVITSLSFDYNAQNKNGCTFKASFQEIQVTSSKRTEVGTYDPPPMSQQDAGAASAPAPGQAPAQAPAGQAARTSSAGTQTTAPQQVSGSAYAAYVASYSGNSSSGPSTRSTSSYNGIR